MSYLQFLLIFLLLPICGFLWLLHGKVGFLTYRLLAIVALIALLYTAPWDNAIILNGVWSYSHSQVLNLTIGVVPIEEYLFYALQVALTGLFAVWLLRRAGQQGF